MSSVFNAILGQEPAIATLRRALEGGRVHHAYRFEGPAGIGKEMAAFALAQSLVCTRGNPVGCGACSACRRAAQLSDEAPCVPQHPDVILVERGLYPPSTLGTSGREATGIGVDQVRRIVLARAGYPPHEGRALVFIVRRAEELTVQAANALLKTLEEPHPQVHFILLTSQPNRLLDTVRSRTLAVRFAPLSERVLATILERHGKPTSVASLAQGSAAEALELGDSARLEEREQFAARVQKALDAPDLGAAVALAAASPSGRDAVKEQLRMLSQRLALDAREQIARDAEQATLAAHRYAAVLDAIDRLERNAQPALVLETMIGRMRA